MSDHRYRPNVGVMVINNHRDILICRRIGYTGAGAWQMPQGGVDDSEDLVNAARRELFEETSIRDVRILATTINSYRYDFPDGPNKQGFRGQQQRWVCMEHLGSDCEIDLSGADSGHQPEFDEWKWADEKEVIKSSPSFKQLIYLKILKHFRSFRTNPEPENSPNARPNRAR